MRLSGRLAAVAAATLAALGASSAIAQHRSGLESLRGERPVIVNDSFISPVAEIFGDVRVGRNVFVASNTVMRADARRRICLGDDTNVQDNVTLLATRGRGRRSYCGRRALSTEKRVSIAHQAEVTNSRIGDFTFIGFRARLRNVVLRDGAFVLHGATLTNVTIPKDRIVPVGAVIRNQRDANALPKKTDANSEFQEEVLQVNHEFAEHYQDLYRDEGYYSVIGAGPAPRTSFNPGLRPRIARGTDLEPYARVVGDVRIGPDGHVGRRSSIRADEGSPIIIGARAQIEDRVTFHALKGTDIRIGDDLNTDDNTVFHGPLTVGDRLSVTDDAVVFRAVIGDDVSIGEGALVVGPADEPLVVPSGTRIPARSVITSQAQVDALQ